MSKLRLEKWVKHDCSLSLYWDQGSSIKDDRPKSEFFGPPPIVQHRPCLEELPPSTTPIHGRPNRITRKRPKRTKFCEADVYGPGEGLRQELRNAFFCVCRRPAYGRPSPVRGRPHWFKLPPPFDRTSLMDGSLWLVQMVGVDKGRSGLQYENNSKLCGGVSLDHTNLSSENCTVPGANVVDYKPSHAEKIVLLRISF